MKTVKLVAKPDTWFKEGTEVYDYDEDYDKKIRISLEAYQEWQKSGMILARGLRVCESDSECEQLGIEYEDGELCDIEEFEVEICDT